MNAIPFLNLPWDHFGDGSFWGWVILGMGHFGDGSFWGLNHFGAGIILGLGSFQGGYHCRACTGPLVSQVASLTFMTG